MGTHQSYKFILDEACDFLLGFLYGHVTGGLNGQVQFPLALLGLLVGWEVGAPHCDTSLRVLTDLCQGLLQQKKQKSNMSTKTHNSHTCQQDSLSQNSR